MSRLFCCLSLLVVSTAVVTFLHAQTAQQQPEANLVGTEQSPVIVKVLPTQKTALEAAQESADRQQRNANDRATIKFNAWLVRIGVLQLVVFLLQLFVFGYQALKLRQSVEAAAQQSSDMKESISQATRAANAMEKSANAATIASENVVVVTQRTAQQMRAYLCVNIGSAAYQDANLVFEGKPILLNTGQTPAHQVGYVAKADVLPFPLPPNFTFPSIEHEQQGFGVLGPHQNFILSAIVSVRYPDAEVNLIKYGQGRSLYMWGTVTYKDVFGEARFTNFCHRLIWIPGPSGETVFGVYLPQHNDAN